MPAGRLGPYQLVAELGSGGMGTVWRADGLHGVVAVKIVHPHLLATPGFFKRFLREAEIGKRIRHENVVATLDVDAVEADGALHHFLVMEYVEGQTLRALLGELGRVPEELCRHIGREVAKGLAAIHAAGVVHRDMKPENVLITKDHVVKVMDLGVARLADEALRLSQSGVFVGSIQYAAPEQFRGGGDVDARADLHALGLILYELATVQHPYQADDFRAVMRRVLDEKPRRPAEINPQLSPFFEELLMQLLEKDRERRFASAGDVAQILDEGEKSAWWKERAKAIRATTKRPLRRIRIPRETALYGRDVELAKLRALYDAANAGDGRVVLIDGEAGIGKSRLVDEFVGLLQRQGEDLNFLFGSYPPGGAATASGAFSTAYREQFGEDGCAAWLSQTPVLVPSFDALLRGETTPSGVEPLTKDSLQTVFVHATRNLAAERPTIVLIDDLHFAPEEGRALFAALAMAVPGHRVLLVGTTRPGLDEKWLSSLERVGAARMSLARLGGKDVARLLIDALKSERTAEDLALKVLMKSDGNPFFVFEILRGLREGQFITRRDDGTWATTRVIADIQIPSSVLELVNARVSDLEPEERDLLDVAACLGFEFDPLLVGEVAGMARIPLLKRLAQIERAHRLVRAAGQRYVFDHHQVQEALYGSLSELLRAEYHAALAEVLEARSGAASTAPSALDGALCVDLAEQFLKGAQGAKALRYLDSALTHLEKGYLNDAAIRLAERALESAGLVVGSERCDLLLRKAACLDILGRRQDERATLDEVLPLADQDGDPALRARVRRSLGVHLWNISRNDEALARLHEALDLAQDAGDQTTEASVTGNLGNVFNALGRTDLALEHYQRSLALARDICDRRGESRAMVNLGVVFYNLGRFAESREHYEQGLAFARDVGDRRIESRATGNLGNVFLALGRNDFAQEHYERGLALAREVGDRAGEAGAIGNLGVVFSSLGRFAEAQDHYVRNIALMREIGNPQSEARTTGNLGNLVLALGRPTFAREQFEQQLAFARESGDRRQEGFALQSIASLALEEGDVTSAERRLAATLELRRAIGQRDGEADTLRARGALLARLRRTDEACVALGDALAIARELSLPGVELLASSGLAALPGGDVAEALVALAEHESRVDLQSAMEARFLLWQATHDRAHLAEAKRLLDFMVAHAPEDCRETMLANVRLHREIAEASAS